MEQKIIEELKKIYDPEIPSNIYDLGLIYGIEFEPIHKVAKITMTLTSAFCPVAEDIVNDVKSIRKNIDGLKEVNVRLTFKPAWNKSKMSDEAKLELGMI